MSGLPSQAAQKQTFADFASVPKADIWLQQRPNSRPGEITLRIMVDLWRFARHRKKFWLVPLMVMAVIYGALAVFTKGSVLAPFIYTVF
jgi:hypothetical protein